MRIIAISDTHGRHKKITRMLPEGDVIVHAGDISPNGHVRDCESFLNWYSELPYQHKIWIAGNHDWALENEHRFMLEEYSRNLGLTYLCDSGIAVDGIKFWGSPVQPWFCSWAYNRERGPEIQKHWNMIPPDIDVLVTHGPPMNILDGVPMVYHYGLNAEERTDHVGCQNLADTINNRLTNLKVNIFGHIHCANGIAVIGNVTYINASICSEEYLACQPFHTIDI